MSSGSKVSADGEHVALEEGNAGGHGHGHGDFDSGNPLAVYFLFGAFLMVTAGVLLGMDVLECFLHTLRLHWVEFQSKFYKADGRTFAPFSHEATLKDF